MTESDVIRFVSDGFDKAKGGDAVNTYSVVAGIHDQGRLPLKSHYPFGWIIYYALHQSSQKDIIARKNMLARYFKLRVTTPHKLHSMVLTEALRLYKDAKDVAYGKRKEETVGFSIVNFMKLWGFANLRPGDWRRKEHDGKTLSSTTEKLITHCTDELVSTKSLPSEEFRIILNKAITDYPESFNLHAQIAELLLLDGKEDDAASMLKRALLLAPGKFYLWSRLAATVDVNVDSHLKVSFLYKALTSPGPDQFKGKIRLALADVLVKRRAFGLALWELQKVKALYESNGWHLSNLFQELLSAVPAGTVPENPEGAYRKVAPLADEKLFSELPDIEVTKTYHKVPGANERSGKDNFGRPAIAWRVTDAAGKNYWLQPHRFNLHPELPMGTRIAIKAFGGKVVKARRLAEN